MKTMIKSRRFVLRPYRKSDALSLAGNINDKTISQNTLGVPFPYTLRDARQWIAKCMKENRKKTPETMSFVVDINGEVAGAIGFHHLVKGHKAEVGYWLARKYWNKGIMTDALKLLTDFGFRKLGLRRIYAHVFIHNRGSMRVLEKCGYKREGIRKNVVKKGNKLIDDVIFAKTR